MDRNLDGIYFRVKREDKWQNICFSDLSDTEMEDVLKNRTEEWLKNMCKVLGRTIKYIGDQLDITRE